MRLALTLLMMLCFDTVVHASELSVVPRAEHAKWQAIGRINVAGFRTREMCTGVLIAPDQVLTAAHCLSGTDGIGPRPEQFTFVAGWIQGDAADAIQARAIWVHPEAYAKGVLNIRYDIALLSLERHTDIAPLPLSQHENASEFGVIGYSSRRPHMLSAAFDCKGVNSSELLRLDCPVSPGNSGGPVLLRDGEDWTVTAIISAMGQAGALAVPVSRLAAR